MSVNVRLPASLPQKVITVPATSIRRAAWGDFVYIITTDQEGKQRAQQRGVTLGPSLGERVIVRSGLSPGTEVVADGSFKLSENALLQIAPPSTQPVAN
jgi:multidrug efflux pump subunit AcrA (membrane-fusion protein)